MLKVRQYMIVSKSYFSLDTMNLRISSIVFDHSSRPSSMSDTQLKGDTLIMGAIEMLNLLVLGFGLTVGNRVPEDDDCWDVISFYGRYFFFHVLSVCLLLIFGTWRSWLHNFLANISGSFSVVLP